MITGTICNDSVKLCLVEELEAKQELNCRNVRKFAVQTHEFCYISSGFCGLPAEDRMKIAYRIWAQMARPDILHIAWNILWSCQYSASKEEWNRDLHRHP